MFENCQEEEVQGLMQRHSEFRVLYHHHKTLDKKVRDAELGVLPIDTVTLHTMKKEKLLAKEKLIHMWEKLRAVTH